MDIIEYFQSKGFKCIEITLKELPIPIRVQKGFSMTKVKALISAMNIRPVDCAVKLLQKSKLLCFSYDYTNLLFIDENQIATAIHILNKNKVLYKLR